MSSNSPSSSGSCSILSQSDKIARRRQLFSNGLVMDLIALKAPSKELLRLRQTCITWNGSFIPILKKKHPPIQLRTKLMPDLGDERDYSSDIIREFVQVMQSSEQIPFTRFHIQPGGDKDEWRSSFNEFLAVFGNSITFMSIRWWKPYLTPQEFRSLVFKQLPNLSTICFDPCEYTPGQGQGQHHAAVLPTVASSGIPNLRQIKVIARFSQPTISMVYLVSEIVQSSTGLEYISSKLGPGYNEAGFTEGILRLLNQPPMKPQLSKLKTLKISSHAHRVQMAQLALLGPAGLRLDVLSLSVVCNRKTPLAERHEITSCFYEFLLSQSPTLKKLTLEFTRIIDEFVYGRNVRAGNARKYELPFCVPQMKRLETFKLIRGEEMLIDVDFDGSNLTETFPVLRRLVYRHDERAWWERKGRNGNLLRDLEHVSHFGVTKLIVWATEDNFRRFDPARFPGVTQLYVKQLDAVVPRKPKTGTQPLNGNTISKLWTKCSCSITLDMDALSGDRPSKELQFEGR